MTNPYGGYGGAPPNFQMPMPPFQGGNPQAFGQGVRDWAQGLRGQFRGMMPQQGGQPPNPQGMAQGFQNRLLNAGPQQGQGNAWGRRGGMGGYGQ